GPFSQSLPVRVIANYPSWDRFVLMMHLRTGLRSLAEIKERRYPLRLSTRQDAAHATRLLTDQIFALYGLTLGDLESWGGGLQWVSRPGEESRLKALEDGGIDAVFDEGIGTWIETALRCGFELLTFEDSVLRQLEAIGWRRALIPADRYAGLKSAHLCLDFGGWPLYTRTSLSDDQACLICSALHEREQLIPWDVRAYTGIDQLGRDSEATPIDVPFHPGAERWYREHGYRG
ncbi:MAG TPA: TAXI family TRAP transporter solute-binding subunit, partial [Terriglobales bacterium]|nr:TAXI family TRAP transporter solute-binding subunit [Terriglobales bacterium]